MAENAVTRRIKELKIALRTATKATVKEDDDNRIVEDIDKTLKIARALRDELMKDCKTLSVEEERKEQLVNLLIKLPCNCATEDTDVMKEVLAFISQYPDSQAFFGHLIWPTKQLLNATTIDRSSSDASLRSDLVSIVLLIAQFNENAGGKIVQECSVDVMHFLIACLKSEIDIRRNAAAAISELASNRSNRNKMGKSGVMKPLVEIIEEKEGDTEAVTHAGRAIRFLCCGMDGNRRGAVSRGAVFAVIDKIKNGILLEEMLETLEELSKGEEAIAELEVMDMLQCLFWILQEDDPAAAVTDKGKEYCMRIIHTMCVHGDVTKINELGKGRQTLQSVADTGTEEARQNAADLLSRLKDIDSK